MAGYQLYSVGSESWQQLTTNPSVEHCLLLAEEVTYLLDEVDFDEIDESKWPEDADALAEQLRQRLISPDWYSDLTYAEGVLWGDMLMQLGGTLGSKLNFDCRPASTWDAISWDCARNAALQGVAGLAEPAFGNGGFRYFGTPVSEVNPFPMYSIHSPTRVAEMSGQLQEIAAWFSRQGGEAAEEFHEGLLLPMQQVAAEDRYLWVETDT